MFIGHPRVSLFLTVRSSINGMVEVFYQVLIAR